MAESPNRATDDVVYLEAPILIAAMQVLEGYNVYHSSTVVRCHVQFNAPLREATTASRGSDIAARFLERFSHLPSFAPNNGVTDELVKRIQSSEGITFAELLLEATLALECSLAFARHDMGGAVPAYAAFEAEGDGHSLIWSSNAPSLSASAVQVAAQGISELLGVKAATGGGSANEGFDAQWAELQHNSSRRRLSPTTAVLMQAALLRGLPCERLGRQHLQIGHGRAQRHIYASMSATTSITAQKICADKHLTNKRLKDLRLPVPKHVKVTEITAAASACEQMGFPVTVKPLKGNKGVAVSANLKNMADVERAFAKAQVEGDEVLVEQFIAGDDHRLLVINGRFVAGLTRQPPHIVGDGERTVDELIDELNAHPYRDRFRLFPVERDDELDRVLRNHDLALTDILPAGQTLALRFNANVSTGGVPIDITGDVHPDNRAMAERAARGVGLDVAGVDFLTTDISRSYRESGGAIIEINARPGLRMHTWPMVGTPRNVAGEVLKLSIPEGEDGRIPIAGIAGDKGTGTTARYLDSLLRGAGMTTGLALRRQAFVDGYSAELTGRQQAHAAAALLKDPEVEALVTTLSPRLAVRQGLGLTQSDILVIQDKVLARETDLFHRGLEIAIAANQGRFVVGSNNAIALEKLAEVDDDRIIMVNLQASEPNLGEHLRAGNVGLTTRWVDESVQLVLQQGEEQLAILSDPGGSSRDGRLKLKRLATGYAFAVAAAYALGLRADELVAAAQNAPDPVPEPARDSPRDRG